LDQCINKIGHALHDLNPVFHGVSYDGRVGSISRELGLEIPTVVQSMYIFKSPNIGGEVTPHQDGTFLYTEPQSVLGFWWPLDQCTLANGCLWAVPGSHKNGVKRRFKRLDPPAYGTEFIPVENEFLDCDGGVPLECDPGSLVLIHHSVVHWSAPNTSSDPRHAYTIHVIDTADGVAYPADNWLQRMDGKPFNIITEFV
jgi:phytanoyl-CoA hydroxylase